MCADQGALLQLLGGVGSLFFSSPNVETYIFCVVVRVMLTSRLVLCACLAGGSVSWNILPLRCIWPSSAIK